VRIVSGLQHLHCSCQLLPTIVATAMFARENLRKKGYNVMQDLNSSTCEHGLCRRDCDKCSAANLRYARFMEKRKTAVCKGKKAAAKATAGRVDAKPQRRRCADPAGGFADAALQHPCPVSVAGLAQLQHRRSGSGAGFSCSGSSWADSELKHRGLGIADSVLKHLDIEGVASCDNASTNGSFDGASLHSAITHMKSGTASPEDGSSQVGEPCTQPVQQALPLRVALSAVPAPHIPTFPRRCSVSMDEDEHNVPPAQTSLALSAERSLREKWEVAAQQLEVDQLHDDDASIAQDLPDESFLQEDRTRPLCRSVLPSESFISSAPQSLRDPMYVRVPRLEAMSSELRLPDALESSGIWPLWDHHAKATKHFYTL